MTPPALDRVIKTCLSKDPENRFQTAHDVKLQLQWVAEGGSQAGLPAPVVARRKNREKLAWAAAAVAALAAIAFAAAFVRRAPAKARTVALRDPDSRGSHVDRSSPHFARRPHDRVQRDRQRGKDTNLGAAPELADCSAPGWY